MTCSWSASRRRRSKAPPTTRLIAFFSVRASMSRAGPSTSSSGDRARTPASAVAHRRRDRAEAALQYAVVADFLIHNTSEILTCAGPAPRRGARQADAGRCRAARSPPHRGTIVFVGCESLLAARGRARRADAVVLDAHGGAVVPGFVDPHTHVVFAGDRRDELRRRLAGATYAEIAAEGGGIVGTRRSRRARRPRRRWPPTRASASTRCCAAARRPARPRAATG